MPRHALRLFAAIMLAISAGAAEEPAPLAPLPPVSGELAGQLTLPKIPGMPTLGWRVTMQPVGAGETRTLRFEASTTSPGVDLRVELTLPRGEIPGTWRIAHAQISATAWWRLLAEQSGAKAIPDDLEVAGQLTIEGSGQWSGGKASGALHVALANGTAASASQHWSASGLAIDAELTFVQSKPDLQKATLRVDTIQVLGLAATNLILDVAGGEGDQLSVTRAEVFALGDVVSLTPFTVDPANPVVATTANFSQLVLSDLAILTPHAVKEARGRIAGRVSVEWRPKAGTVSAEGALASLRGETAMLRLAPSPGLLTGRVPARLSLLPFISIKNPALDTLRRVEMGEDSLTVDVLQVDLFRAAGEGARSAQIRIEARPADDRDVKHITFTVNLAGPLDQVLRLGMDKKSSLQLHSGK